ncbi:prephenate dehydratase [Baekduia soli]|uniref:Prephenate dehydratase n=1 Tax=Baekduia soli TaxID=496014 RepID=A0A5B8U1C1_9ACTN|nr:prephenate dehydratase [Baekduia soli]QEC46803.1 prephenate dehydratase [Baekduia soli]
MRLGFLGPQGTFTHAALLASRHAEGAQAVPFATERETILAAESGAVDAALVPIENALEGGVNATLDTLALDAPQARIVGEELLAISHALIARPGVAEAAIEVVVSHPQALGQCRRFLADVLPGRRAVAATATAEAVRTVAAATEPWAAIGPAAAAALHGCVVLREGIEDEHGNVTRFIWVAGPGPPEAPFAAGAGGAWKTSLVFHGAGDTTPGWLVGCLGAFASRGINLVRIESRPLKRGLGHYQFLVDFEGRAQDPDVAGAIAALAAHCEQVRVLGSYPAAA